MFVNKKEAEEHDKMLELAENITALIEANITGIDEKASEAIGILLSKHREDLARACKGQPEVLLEVLSDTASNEKVVTPISVNMKS
jgi:dsDNA-binding SOS-regulon protein